MKFRRADPLITGQAARALTIIMVSWLPMPMTTAHWYGMIIILLKIGLAKRAITSLPTWQIKPLTISHPTFLFLLTDLSSCFGRQAPCTLRTSGRRNTLKYPKASFVWDGIKQEKKFIKIK